MDSITRATGEAKRVMTSLDFDQQMGWAGKKSLRAEEETGRTALDSGVAVGVMLSSLSPRVSAAEGHPCKSDSWKRQTRSIMEYCFSAL
jgi:hypothetical protein